MLTEVLMRLQDTIKRDIEEVVPEATVGPVLIVGLLQEPAFDLIVRTAPRDYSEVSSDNRIRLAEAMRKLATDIDPRED